jgi:hypothetical protein
MRTIVSVVFLAFAAPALAQTPPPRDVKCEATRYAIDLDTPTCAEFNSRPVAMDGVLGSSGMEVSGPVAVMGRKEGYRYSVVAHKPDRQNVYVRAPREADLPQLARQFNGWTRNGSDWSHIRTVRNAWVLTFRSAGQRCVYFDNYGPYSFNGYEWEVTGVACDEDKARVGTEHTDLEIIGMLARVTPKK